MKQCAIITGALGGIGYETAKTFLSRGYTVIGMDVRPASDCTEQIAALGEDFVYVAGNLASADDRASLVNTAIQTAGRIDALVNVAG